MLMICKCCASVLCTKMFKIMGYLCFDKHFQNRFAPYNLGDKGYLLMSWSMMTPYSLEELEEGSLLYLERR
jgi:hypothetical protein